MTQTLILRIRLPLLAVIPARQKSNRSNCTHTCHTHSNTIVIAFKKRSKEIWRHAVCWSLCNGAGELHVFVHIFVGLYNRCLRVQSGGQSVESCASFASSIGQNNDLFPVAWQVRKTQGYQRNVGWDAQTPPNAVGLWNVLCDSKKCIVWSRTYSNIMLRISHDVILVQSF